MVSIASNVSQYGLYHDQMYGYTPTNGLVTQGAGASATMALK